MFYFGVQHANWFFHYFGVNYTVMGLTPQDYLLRSADGLFLPLLILAAVALVFLWGLRLVSGRISAARTRRLKRLGAAAAGIGGVLAIGLAAVAITEPALFADYYAIPGLCLAGGALLLALASNLQRIGSSAGRPLPGWVGVTEWGALFVVVSVGLFWSVTDYSAAVGTTRGYDTQMQLADAPDAILYSQQRLSLPAMSARELPCPQPGESEGAYLYRYENLKLVFASGSQYFFLPSGWPEAGGIAIVIPRSESLRLEFVPQGLAQGAAC